MADYYALEFVGGPDGTQQPPKKLDGRLVGAKERRVRAVKPAIALAAGDRLYLGRLPANALLHTIAVNTDTSFGSSTLSIGTTAAPTKYANAKTVTATDVLTSIGPKAASLILPVASADEDIWLTVGTATIVAGTVAAFVWAYTTAT